MALLFLLQNDTPKTDTVHSKMNAIADPIPIPIFALLPKPEGWLVPSEASVLLGAVDVMAFVLVATGLAKRMPLT